MSISHWHSLLPFTAISFVALTSSSSLALSSWQSPSREREFEQKNEMIMADDHVKVTTQTQAYTLLQQLNLTDEQKQKIKQIHYRYKRQISNKYQDVAVLQQQLSDMIVGTDAVELIRVKNQELVNLRQEISTLRFESILATREILTPQQRQKFRELVKSQLAK